MHDLNPYGEPLRALEDEIAELDQRKSTILEEINWFESNSEEDLQNRLNEYLSQLKQLRNKHSETEDKIAAILKERKALKFETPIIHNPNIWTTISITVSMTMVQQIRLIRAQRKLERSQQAEEKEKKKLSTQISKISKDADNTQMAFERYVSFDLAACRSALERIEEELPPLRLRAKLIALQKESVDRALKPVVDQLRQYEAMRQEAEAKRVRAAALDRQLSHADNSYERAMVHKECEAEFNVGSPRKVLAEAERDLNRIDRDYEKTYKRAKEIGQKAARRIDVIVIDGINLCYDGNQFIGLSVLETLIPILQNNFEVTIVFDAAIRSMVKLNDKEISEILGGRSRVHVVATKGKADETVLALAEDDRHTYVLSNDRFGEYNDKRAIREERVLRHEIVNGRILIHDLDVNAEYRLA